MSENILLEDNSKIVLEKTYLGCKSNVYLLKQVISKTVNDNYKNQLEKNRDSFLKIINDCLAVASAFNTTLCDINFLKKAKLSAILKFNLFADDSTQNSAKTILTFMNQEMFNTIKVLDANDNCLDEIKNIALTYNKTLEKCIADTKKYLLNDPSKYDEITKKKKEKIDGKKKKAKKTNKNKTKNNHD